jgi:hypothetical protein
LEYWIYGEDSPKGKKGDLMYIEYWPNDRIEQQVGIAENRASDANR